MNETIPWYRHFSWCLLIALILGILEIAYISWTVFHLNTLPDFLQPFGTMIVSYIVIPFYVLLASAVCCNLAALLKWNRWLALSSAILYVQAGAFCLMTPWTCLPASLCLIAMGWCVHTGR